MKLQTIVDIQPSAWKIGYGDKILLVGSCFADSIGQMMAQRGLQVTCNPFGTLYNPVSIVQALQMIDIPPLVEHEGLWHSMAHHGSFSHATEEETREAVAQSIETMQHALQEANVVIVTFGTAWVYEMKDPAWLTGSGASPVVGNCHKLPANYFTRRRLSVDEIEVLWRPLIAKYPDKHWLFTVSPIRHIKDGLHENQLSKATLLQAVEAISNQQSVVSYFPSYEIMLDELRDYRFYAEDMVHPSLQAAEYVFGKFLSFAFPDEERSRLEERRKAFKASQHRPMH